MSGFTNIQLALGAAGNPFPPTYLVASSSNSPESGKSLDSINWVASGVFASTKVFATIAHSPPLDRWVMAASGGGAGADLGRSNDQAATWLAQSSGQGQNYDTIKWAFGANFYLGSNNGNIFVSPTGLTGSWASSLFASGLFYRSYRLGLTLDGTILASAGDDTADLTIPKIAYTIDGANWLAGVTTGLPTGVIGNSLRCIAHDVGRNLWWVMNADGRLYTKASLSVAGAWAFVAALNSSPLSYTQSIAFKTGGGTNAIVATTGVLNSGLWVSTNGGVTFTQELPTDTLNNVLWSDYFNCFVAVGPKIFTGAPGAWTEQLARPIGVTYSSVAEALV